MIGTAWPRATAERYYRNIVGPQATSRLRRWNADRAPGSPPALAAQWLERLDVQEHLALIRRTCAR